MIALTKEKREELIERYSQQIETFKYHLSKIGTDHFDGEAYSELLLKTEIAIASLTAVPFGWEIAGHIFPTLEDALKPGYMETPEPIYCEPPVPKIKLPDELEISSLVSPACDKWHQADGWNMCLAEIKRLNGWKE